MNGFGHIDYTWFSPVVFAMSEVPNDPYKTSDRYQDKLLLSDARGQHIQFIQKRWFPKTTKEDILVYVDSKYQYRPDIISVDYYNTPLYAWALLAANGMRSVWELTAGTYIKIPNIAEVMEGLN